MAAAAGVRHEETLTGFKWIARVPGLRYGYEEALGYCVDPASRARQGRRQRGAAARRDGRGARAQGRTLLDVLDDLAVAHGVHATDALSVRVADLSLIGDGDGAAALGPARELGGRGGRGGSTTWPTGRPGLPPTDGLRYHLADGSRVIVRPERHRAQAQGLPRGRRAGRRTRRAGEARAEAPARLARSAASMAELTAP